MRRSNGFTVIELFVAITIVVLAGTLAIIQKNDLEASQRDQQRKTAINSFYYGLKNGYYKDHSSYPPTIDEKKLPYIDKTLFIDPKGQKIGEPEANYHYKGLNCEAEKCQKFELSAHLEKEGRYQKSSND